MLSNAMIALIRTVVPLIIGAAGVWIAHTLGVAEPPPELVPWAVAVVTALYWMAVHWLEARWPKLGILLGYPAAPRYPAAGTAGPVRR